MKKRFLSLTLVLCMVVNIVVMFPIIVNAATSGTCGANLTWTFDNGTLTISGTGAMRNYTIFNRAPWFDSYNSSIKTIVIGNGVTSIGDYAFAWCNKLTSCAIPSNVNSIGSYAFYCCDDLVSVAIGNGITNIGNAAFSDCSSLQSIDIPNTVTAIKNNTFSRCSQLASITIGNGVTSIGVCAFCECNNISNIVIPDNISSIDDYAFLSCENLKSVTIGKNFRNMGQRIFEDCKNLINITVQDNNTYYSSLDGVLYNKNKSTLICYPAGKSGSYTTPNTVTSISSFAFEYCTNLNSVTISNSVKTIGNHAFEYCSSLRSVIISDSVTSIGEFTFLDCDKLTYISIGSGVTTIPYAMFADCNSLASVTIPNGVTNINSCVFTGCTHLASVTISNSVKFIGSNLLDGCNNFKNVYYNGSENEWKQVSISEYNDCLRNATIHYNYQTQQNQSSNWTEITYNSITYDLLSQPINIMKDSDIEVSVKVSYKEGNGNEKIWLSQNTEKAIELQNNVSKTFKPAKTFNEDQDIYILIINEQTGDVKSYRTRLLITDKTADGDMFPDSGIEGLNFKLGKNVGFTIPESVPVFGDTEIKWDFGFIPISVEYDREDSNKINVVFGTSIAKSDGEEDKYFKNFDFKKYKKDFKKAASKQGRTLKQLRNDFKMSNDYKKMSLFGGKVIGGGSGEPSFDFDVAGYAEMKVIDGKLKFTEGQLCLNAEISYTYQGQLFIWVVPVYYEIGGGIGAGFEGNMININPDNFTPEFEAYLTAKIKAELGAGIGVAKVATVGVAGEGSLNLKTALHKDYTKSWGEGSANFNVKVFGKEVAKKDFAKGEFLIYETGNSNGLIKSNAIRLMSAENDNLYSQIDINSVYENESREYTKNPSSWCKNEAQLRLMSAEFSNKNQKKLAENVYTESAPMMCEIDGKKILVMLWDNIERSDSDRTMLVYSVYDSDNDIWSEPVPVADDGTADFYPCFNDGYLVWQNQKNNISDKMTLAEIAEDGEICLAKWNGNGFDMPVAITDNSTLDTMPFVASNENETSVVWITNTENNILGITGTNSIMKRNFNGTNGGDTVCVKSDFSAITDLTAGYSNGALNIAYVTDSDNDFETLNDRDISLISGTTETAFTDNDILDSNPVFDGDKLYYYSGGNIAYSSLDKSVQGTVFEEEKAGLTDAFDLCSNVSDTAILWTKAVEGGTEIFCALKRDGEWSDEIKVSNAGNQSRYPTGILENDGTMYIAFNNTIWGDSEIEQSDLYTLSLIPSYDISVEDAYIDEDKMTVYAIVKNSGELPIEEYIVSITDNGAMNSETIISEPLKAGETAEIELEYIKPENLTYRDITFNVAIEDDEYNLNNNSFDLTVGHCDIEVDNLGSYEMLPMSAITATINNIGYSDSGRVIAYLRKDTADGEIAETQIIDNLSAGGSQEITFNYNIVENDNIKWYVTATAENEEISLGNNDAYIINNYVNEVSDYKQAILRYAYADNTLTVNAYAENNTNSDISADFIIGVYSSTNKLKALSRQNSELNKYDSISPNFTIDEYVYENGDYIKLFLWEGFTNIKPLTNPDYALLEIE